MEELDTIATQKSWAQGSLQKPFTSIVALYMHEQLSLDQAVREITSVIKNIYYADGDVDSYLLDLWLTALHTSKKLPRPTTTPPDLPTPLQSRLLALLETLRRQPNPIPHPQIDTQNPIPDDPFATPPNRSATSSTTNLISDSIPSQQQQQQQKDIYQRGQQESQHTYKYNYDSTSRSTSTRSGAGKQKRVIWSQLPRFLDGVRIVLHDEPGRPSTGFAELEVCAWEDLVSFLALCARHQIVPDPVPSPEDVAARERNENGMDREGEGTGGLDAVAVRMLKGALEVRHFPTEVLSHQQDHHQHYQRHHDHEGTTSKILNKIKKSDKKREQEAAEEEARERETGQIAEAVKLNVYVAAAALWAVIMGEELWERQGQKVESPVGLSLEPVPEVPPGKISKSRWRMWIDRFQFMSLREDLRISTRELAAEAAAVMLRVV